MGVTAIKGFDNKTSERVEIIDVANGGAFTYCLPFQTVSFDIWIPWCESEVDFGYYHKYMSIYVRNPSIEYAIWQSNEGGIDRVRYNTGRWWRPNAPGVGGDSSVDGNRVVEIRADGSLVFQRIAN
jgi:hypothetical protein